MNLLYHLLIYLIIFSGVFHLGLPILLDALISLVLFYFINKLIAALIFNFLIISSCYLIGFYIDTSEVYFREHEKFSTQYFSYLPLVNSNKMQPYGDLAAMLPLHLREKIAEPRTIEFVTDRKGYRNREYINNPDFILVGDSFVVGNGTTQNSIITEQLSRHFLNLKFLNLGYPSDPIHYENTVRKNIESFGPKTKLLVFYFEGNDFGHATKDDNDELNFSELIYKLIFHFEDIKTNYLIRFYPKSNTLIRGVRWKGLLFISKIFSPPPLEKIEHEGSDVVLIETIGKHKVGFYKPYTKKTLESSLDTYTWNDKELIDRISAIFFIPTKYRVYKNIQINSGFDILKKSYSKYCIPVIDLTPTLKDYADKILKEGKYVYWRDDTHWNDLGISAAVDRIKVHLNKELDTSAKIKICN